MRILFLGDIVGRSGRTALIKNLPELIGRWGLDFVVANAENATSGIGLSIEHANDILSNGVDCITLGDHSFDQREMIQYIEQEPRIIRPINFAKAAPGNGYGIFRTKSGKKVAVLQVLGQVFMKKSFSNPFEAIDRVLTRLNMSNNCDAILVDLHAEATSEKMALGHWCDGRVSLAVGTHTHIPTADLQILQKGTAYQTDAGMCGDYDSVIGMDKLEPISRFVTGMNKTRFSPALGEATLCGVFLEVDRLGLPKKICPISIGGRLYHRKVEF
tara:strand:- start:286 stop:1101 length:816 start_codon:yes stop_codon:yes gene_type:complete